MVSKKNRSLATATDEQASVSTSETTSGTASNNIIPKEQEKATGNFSDRNDVSVYEVLGENASLEKRNRKLMEDVERLTKRLKLERQITNGNVERCTIFGGLFNHYI